MRLRRSALGPVVLAACGLACLPRAGAADGGVGLPARFRGPMILAMQAAPGPDATPPPEAKLPAGKGREALLKYCNECHEATVVTKKHYTRERWSDTIDQMVSKGLEAPDDALAEINEYLAANFGPVKKDPEAKPPTP